MESVAQPKEIQGDGGLSCLRRKESPGTRMALPALQEMRCTASPQLD